MSPNEEYLFYSLFTILILLHSTYFTLAIKCSDCVISTIISLSIFRSWSYFPPVSNFPFVEYFAALSELVSMIHRFIGNLLKWDILELKTWATKRIIFWHCVLFYSPIPEIFFFRCHCRIHFPTILSFEIKSILTICLSLPHYPVGQGEQTSFLSLSSPLFVFFNSFLFQDKLHFLKHILKQWITQWLNCLWGHFWCCLAHSCTFCTRKLLTVLSFRYKQAQTTW